MRQVILASGVTGGGGERGPLTLLSDREISADQPGKERQGKGRNGEMGKNWFSEPLKFVLGLPKWKLSTGKSISFHILDEQNTRQNTELKRVEEACCSKCFIVSVISFHVYFDKQVHKKLEKKPKQATKKKKKKIKPWILLNQMRTKKQMPAAALRHNFFLA